MRGRVAAKAAKVSRVSPAVPALEECLTLESSCAAETKCGFLFRGLLGDDVPHIKCPANLLESLSRVRAVEQIRQRERLAACIGKPENHSRLVRSRYVVGRIVESKRMNLFMGAIIMTNTFLMSIELDSKPAADASPGEALTFFDYPSFSPDFFDVAERFFLTVFCLEMLARCFAFGIALFAQGWTYVDLCSIIPSLVSTILGDGSGATTVLRTFRVFKLLRLVRFVRLFRKLYVIAQGFLSAMGPLTWIVLLLMGIVYVVAIFMTNAIGHNDAYDCEDPSIEHCVRFDRGRYFGSTSRTIVTLFQIMTGDSWTSVVRPIVEGPSPWLLFCFILFIFFTSFGLISMIVAVICEHMDAVFKDDEQEHAAELTDDRKAVLDALSVVFDNIDESKDKVASREELRQALSSNAAVDCLAEAGYNALEVEELRELLEVFDRLLEDGASSAASCECNDAEWGMRLSDFMGIALRLRGEPSARDVMALFFQVKGMMLRIKGMRAWASQTATAISGHDPDSDTVCLEKRLVSLNEAQREILQHATFLAG